MDLNNEEKKSPGTTRTNYRNKTLRIDNTDENKIHHLLPVGTYIFYLYCVLKLSRFCWNSVSL